MFLSFYENAESPDSVFIKLLQNSRRLIPLPWTGGHRPGWSNTTINISDFMKLVFDKTYIWKCTVFDLVIYLQMKMMGLQDYIINGLE